MSSLFIRNALEELSHIPGLILLIGFFHLSPCIALTLYTQAAAEAEEAEEEPEEEEKKPAPEGEAKTEVKLTAPSLSAPAPAKNALDTSLDELLGSEDVTTLLDRRVRRRKKQDDVWAILDSVDVSNFKELVPKMALEYPFDLDTFQKEALYHLENNESVFVAAHTSAGKVQLLNL